MLYCVNSNEQKKKTHRKVCFLFLLGDRALRYSNRR
jgi:hypothetical protein